MIPQSISFSYLVNGTIGIVPVQAPGTGAAWCGSGNTLKLLPHPGSNLLSYFITSVPSSLVFVTFHTQINCSDIIARKDVSSHYSTN